MDDSVFFSIQLSVKALMLEIKTLGSVSSCCAIRKKVISVIKHLTANFLKLILIAILFASPLAWYVMTRWLADYEYRITISWDIYLVSALAVVFISLGTISYQAIKAGLVNPVKNLRDQ